MVNLSHGLFGIYPLLCYPCKISSRRGFLDVRDERDETRREGSQLFLNLGIYGVPKAILEDRGFKTVLAVRELESIVRRVGGVSNIHTVIRSTESEFESMYNHYNCGSIAAQSTVLQAHFHLFSKKLTQTISTLNYGLNKKNNNLT